MPVDQVVDFMVKLIDDSYKDLPPVITMEATEMGRLTQPAALALKAKILLWAASPSSMATRSMQTLEIKKENRSSIKNSAVKNG